MITCKFVWGRRFHRMVQSFCLAIQNTSEGRGGGFEHSGLILYMIQLVVNECENLVYCPNGSLTLQKSVRVGHITNKCNVEGL